MARLADLSSAVKTHLSDVSDPTIRRYLRRAAQQFCQDSKIWDVNIGSMELAPATNPSLRRRIPVPSETFALPSQSYLNALSRVRYAYTVNDEPEKLPNGMWGYDIPSRMLVLEPSAIDQTTTIYVDAILQTASNATQLPDWMAELWGEAISDYAIFEIMSMPKEAWSNPELAGVFLAKYENRVSESTVAKARKGSLQPVRRGVIPFN